MKCAHSDTPNPCRFGHRCIFNMPKICLFAHTTLAKDETKSVNDDLAKKIENRFKTAENKIELLRKTLDEKDKNISLLEAKITTLETTFTEKLASIEKHVTEKENKFKCNKCDFETNSETGLKTHTSKKHKQEKDNGETAFPQQCKLCDKILKSNKEKKIHMRTH